MEYHLQALRCITSWRFRFREVIRSERRITTLIWAQFILVTGTLLGHRKTRLCPKRGNRVTGTFARGPGADVPVTRESQNFALRGRELRQPCR